MTILAPDRAATAPADDEWTLDSARLLYRIDDWGKGYSDMGRLMLIRPDILKLDMSLVHGIESRYNIGAARAAVAWADAVGAKLCAEGIETESQLCAPRELGVHYAQGFYLGRPAPSVGAAPQHSRPEETAQQVRL